MLRIASCEDVKADALLLRQMVEEYLDENSYTGQIDVFESGEALLAAFRPGLYQIVFVDIYLQDLNGMQVARRLRELDEELSIIFLTISEGHALQSYSIRAAHYLTKPLDYSLLSEAMARCGSKLDEYSRQIEVFEHRIPVSIRLQDILYIEAVRRHRVIHTVKGAVNTSMTMEVLKMRTVDSSFVRCHRGFVINMRKISKVLDRDIVMEDGKLVPIGKTYAEEFRQRHSHYVLALARARKMTGPTAEAVLSSGFVT